MNKKTIKLFEYEEKIVDLGQKDAEYFSLVNERFRSQNGVGLFDVYPRGGKFVIRANNYVGVIRIGDYNLQIMPKIGRQGGLAEESAVFNIFYMLAYTKRLKIIDSGLAFLRSVKNNDFFEILIGLFAENLLKLVRGGLNKEYLLNRDNLPFVKGKIDFNGQIKRNSIIKSRFFLEFDEFSEDSLLNRIFKYVSQLLLKESKDQRNIKSLQELVFVFSDVSEQIISVDDFKKIQINRLNVKYEQVISLCKIFISQSTLELSIKNIETFAFVFDMNKLFEEFVGEFIKRNLHENFSRIELQKPVKNFVQDKIVGGISYGQCFNMKPDICFFKDSITPCLIMDTKYKILNTDKKEGVSQGDLYQMNAYAEKYNCEKIILLYPKNYSRSEREVFFKIDNKKEIHVKTVNLEIDLRKDRELLKSELAGVLNV
jgi:5-methylcytosine-specific restriction enzyme subunit McrC